MNSSAPPPPSSSSSSSPASTSTSIRAGKQTQLNSSSSSPPPPPFTLSLRSPELQAEFLRGNLFLRLNFVLMDNWTEPETGPWVSVSNYHRRIAKPQISSTNSHKCLLIFVFPECRNKFKPHSDDSESSGVSSTTSPVASPFSLTPSSSPSSSSSTSPSPGFKDRQGEPAGSTVRTYVKWLARPGGEDPLIENISLRDFDELLLVYCADVKQTGSTLGCGILCFRDLVGPIWKLKLLSLFSSSVTVQPRAPFWTEGIQKPLPPTRPRAKGNDHRFLRARKSIKTGEQKQRFSVWLSSFPSFH